jgi:PAS domain S-box-containing protein
LNAPDGVRAPEPVPGTAQESPDALDQLLGALVESASDALLVCDKSQRIVRANSVCEQMFGYPRAALLGQPLVMLIPERFRSSHPQHVAHFGVTGKTIRRMGGIGNEARVFGVRANGEEFPIEASISHLKSDTNILYTVILRDITERIRHRDELEHSRARLRELYDGLQTIREEERKRIARELHDSLGQTLAALRIDISLLKNDLPADLLALKQRAAGIEDLLLNTIISVRRISADLRPRLLDDLGLTAAIESLAEDFSKRHGIACKLDLPNVEAALGDQAASSLFRMVQESLTNVVKHAHATEVTISVCIDGDSLKLRVKDNGRGIDESESRRSDSFGLIGMRERTWALGGGFDLISELGEGTTLIITVPLETKSAA